MRTKEEIMKEIFSDENKPNEYLFLEVLCDIRDQLAKAINKQEIETEGV